MSTFKFRASNPSRRGSALPFMLLIIFSLTAVAVAFNVSTLASERRNSGIEDDVRAHSILDAAVAESVTAISAGFSGTVGDQANPAYLDGGLFWVASTDLGSNRYRLDAVAMAGSGRAAAEVVVERVVDSPLFTSVLNSDEQLTLNADVEIDSFDSASGPYVASNTQVINGVTHDFANKHGDVTSNAGIILNANATVFGDAIPGMGYAVSTAATGSYVSGSTTPATSPFNFPPIPIPTTPQVGNLVLGVGSSSTLSSGSYGLGTLQIGKSATLTIQGPADILVDDFYGGKDGNLMIDATNGPVTFFVKNTYTHISGFEAQPVPGSPMAVAFMIDGAQDIVFPASAKVRGAYYAPNANITFSNYNEAWGSFGAKRIDMSNSMQFHYDEDLSKHWSGGKGNGTQPVDVLAWTPDGVTGAWARDRRDPFVVLGVAAPALKSPANSWQ